MALTDRELAIVEELALKVISNAELRLTFIANPRQVIDAHAPDINEESKVNIASNAGEIIELTKNMDDVSAAAAYWAKFA